MVIRSKTLFVLIGNDRTGKTELQRYLIEKLCAEWYKRLTCNVLLDIRHPEIKRKYRNASFGSRSIQEKINEYKSVDNYFQNHFRDADVAFVSSHLKVDDIRQIIEEGKKRYYNVNAVFFSNSIESNGGHNSEISSLNWDEKFVIENPRSRAIASRG